MVISPHKGEGLDGTVWKICEQIDTKRTLVPITRIENFIFNEELLNYKDAVILDYVEYGWDWNLENSGTHLFGVNTNNFPHFRGEEWKKFDDWVSGLKSKTYFKREMLADAYPPNVHPIDYPCWVKVPEAVSRESFNQRPLSLFNFWGRSHEARVSLHIDILEHGRTNGFQVCDNIYHLNGYLSEEKGEKWATFWQPHYMRVDIVEILKIASLSKITVAMPGAGRKTFRGTGEAPCASAMLMHKDNLLYSYKWIDGVNCIKFTKFGEEIEAIETALSDPNLYDIYVNGVKNCRNYQVDKYVSEYLLPIINA